MPGLRNDIEFPTLDGTVLRGWFYPPAAPGKQPCIIMANGLAALKQQFLPSFAEGFQSAGYGVLLYDHRNWGSSEGTPRKESDPAQQGRDYSDAFDYAASLPEVDDCRIIFWGSSMAGGATIYASAFDHRIRATIVQVPFVSGEAQAGLLNKHLPDLYKNRQAIKAGSEHATLQVFPRTSEGARSPDCPALFKDPGMIPCLDYLNNHNLGWEGVVTVNTLLNIYGFEPAAFIHRIAPTPFLMVITDNDAEASTATQLRAYELAREPKRLVILRKAGHFDPYFGITFEKNMKHQLRFLRDVLQDDTGIEV
ncbi:alpha/beta superfamily hydrolase [Stachybotrys elegans]|uniref:Alpha/beta superfamily hydrolase n=1 Tax=Stachybotrys elegans TaxID=80388 RepID=A0A8K0WND0_9HYPO|nr:alpha/beta superfamily hydrolase [Stachybotrys elegans]